MNTYEKETENLLRKLGANGTYTGFRYISYGVMLIIDNPLLLTHICKGLYMEIAIHFNTNVYCVERNIRTVKELIFKKQRYKLKRIFGDNRRLSNSEFLDCLVVYISENINTRSE